MNIEPQTPEVKPARKDNIPTDPSSPQVNPSFKPGDPVKRPMTSPDEQPERDDTEKKYGYENEYNTV